MITQLSSSLTVHVMSLISIDRSRETPTPSSRSTSAGICFLQRTIVTPLVMILAEASRRR